MNGLRPLLPALLAFVLVSCAGVPRRAVPLMPYEDRIQLASIYIQKGQPDMAVPLLEDAVDQDQERPEAWAMLGELSWLKGELKESSRYLEKALQKGGEDAVVLNNLAWVESAKGEQERALALADRAIAQDPSPLYPYLETRARVLLELGRYREAAADAEAALSLTPAYDTKMRQQLEQLIGELKDLGAGEGGPYY